jgi:hypothetical protein
MRVEAHGGLELDERIREATGIPVEETEVVTRHRLGRVQRNHPLELCDGLCCVESPSFLFVGARRRRQVAALGLVLNTEVEPGVRQLLVLPLHLLQLRDPFVDPAGPQQREAEVQPLARRVRAHLERSAELVDGFSPRRGILVERLPEISTSPEVLFAGGLWRLAHEGHRGEREDHDACARGVQGHVVRSRCQTRVSWLMGTVTVSSKPSGQRIVSASTLVATPSPKCSRSVLCPA